MLYDNKPQKTSLALEFEAEIKESYLDRHQNHSMEIYYSVNDEYVKWLENKIIRAAIKADDALISADCLTPSHEEKIMIDGKICTYIGYTEFSGHDAFDENYDIVYFTHYKLIN